ncbi:MAG: hypothetical protein EOO61_22295 [Hymenobacter sp.]|nr:MAG: hypothetical protein EOO61_22295 [Hymenobacter sp.]
MTFGRFKSFKKILGIIPFGSGNGLARFLKIPLNPGNAVRVINSLNVTSFSHGTGCVRNSLLCSYRVLLC